ncbi:magnesium transporter CorA family protein [Lacticaseibacillus saniviri]|uniref:Metal ion transporter, MIT family n=1 Tax=Lacticaseibacillus saniviri JCM 17471 = DSM 24301 TaxID=1293598 RepID=A0A0R2MP88_9LACO|nr:magnesium transporter CorA family protein [Lacticaseibacillus saniviri]KRO15461.1 metal ion transporter, MIT family [Lacticaseibacillus saniviri JCM 17471 = DSM 24301]MCG4282257.1 magnesium transporter CorA family protein [Lacticaseibacillus saniviri]
MQTQWYFDQGELKEATDTANCQWLAITAPTDSEMAALETTYHLSKSQLAAALDQRENPRVEIGLHVEDPAMVILRYPVQTHSAMGYRQYQTLPLALFVLDKQIITITQEPLPLEEYLGNHLIQTFAPETFLLKLLWVTLHQFVEDMDRLNNEIDSMEGSLGHAAKNTQLYQIMAMQKSLIFFDDALGHSEQLLSILHDGPKFFNTPESANNLHDVTVEVEQAQSMVRTGSKVLEQYNTAVSSVISNNLNLIMKVLTSITIILTIPTIVGGIYGMNVRLPFAHAYNAFWWLMLITAVACALVAWWLKRHDYF